MFLRMVVIKNTVPFKKVLHFSLSSYSNIRNFLGKNLVIKETRILVIV